MILSYIEPIETEKDAGQLRLTVCSETVDPEYKERIIYCAYRAFLRRAAWGDLTNVNCID